MRVVVQGAPSNKRGDTRASMARRTEPPHRFLVRHRGCLIGLVEWTCNKFPSARLLSGGFTATAVPGQRQARHEPIGPRIDDIDQLAQLPHLVVVDAACKVRGIGGFAEGGEIGQRYGSVRIFAFSRSNSSRVRVPLSSRPLSSSKR